MGLGEVVEASCMGVLSGRARWAPCTRIRCRPVQFSVVVAMTTPPAQLTLDPRYLGYDGNVVAGRDFIRPWPETNFNVVDNPLIRIGIWRAVNA